MRNFADYISRKKKEHGSKFDPGDLAKKFIPFFENGKRIKVKMHYGEIEFGVVGVTSGWKPAFLLVHRSSDIGSSTLLCNRDQIIGVQHKKGGKYE